MVIELNVEERKPTEQELLFEETHKRSMELVRRTENMMIEVVKTQVIVESFMIELLEAYGRDPQHFLFTGMKIKECRDKINPPEVGRAIWGLLSFCTCVRNELVHSLNPKRIKEESDHVREAYLAVTTGERQKQEIRDANDTEMVTNAFRHCGGFIAVAADAKISADRKKGA